MKRIFLLLILVISLCDCFASHIKGGYFTYDYKGAGIVDASASRYDITLTIYMACNPTANQVDAMINFSFFNTATGNFLYNRPVGMLQRFEITKQFDEPCITGNQIACYYTIIVYKLSDFELPPLPGGYTISFQRCCRINNMENIDNSGNTGNTWTIQLPGSTTLPIGETNSSPQFAINDTAVVCEDSYFTFPFKATDPNGDSLSYSLCDAYQGAGIGGANPVTATAPPYPIVPYTSPFAGSQPMGAAVVIDPKTGLISGTAPGITRGSGEYVVCVCISEYRDGIKIGETRKELHIRVGSCNVISANLDSVYNSCDAFTQVFSNNSPSTDITANFWDFGINDVGTDTSNLAVATFTYPDTGTYQLTLIVNKGQQCTDTSTSIVRIYPGFNPGFTVNGSCMNTVIQFTDTTFTRYGVVDSWEWDFGDPNSFADRSSLKNPSYVYANPGVYSVKLTVTNSKGCKKVITRQVTIIDKPEISLLFRASANCGQDTLILGVSSNTPSTFSWTPATNIINPSSATPLVYPVVPTTYYVTVNAGGCIAKDSVFIDVVSSVSLDAGNDTTICKTDSVMLATVSNGINYSWTPVTGLSDGAIKSPVARPDFTTTYTVKARVGKCLATSDIKIAVVPYPVANAGPDTSLCFGDATQLNASGGNVFTWSPPFNLSDADIANPVAKPPRTTVYRLTVRDTQSACPKPSTDSIVVTILPRVVADAGPRDTSIVLNQPFQLNGSGGSSYAWSPPIGLSDPFIKNPVASLKDNQRYILTVASNANCKATDTIDIKVFKLDAGFYVPTAFSPNSDGLNDLLRPVAPGIKNLSYFRVYNRWGKLMFSTSILGLGWNGRFEGKDQDSGTFVWMAEGENYDGRKISAKGHFILTR